MFLRRFFTLAACVAALNVLPLRATAGPALLFDPNDGKVLYSEDADVLWHPASLTKIMTAYITFKALKSGRLKLDDKVVCSIKALKEPPSKLGLPVGTEISVELALKAIIVKSANDVTVMLGERIAGSEEAFVQLMNKTAQQLGMTRTNFVNSNGLPAKQQITTARDMAKLVRAVTTEFSEYSHIWGMRYVRIGGKRLRSHNSLLRNFEGADGFKTGFTCDSGFNVVASAKRDGRRLMAVVFGESSSAEREVRAGSLLEHGFETYGWKQLFNTESIDDSPARLKSSSAPSVRETVAAWSCNPKRAKAAMRKIRREKRLERLRRKREAIKRRKRESGGDVMQASPISWPPAQVDIKPSFQAGQ